jgi:hypothetical protein
LKPPGTTYTGRRLVGPNGEVHGVDVRVNGRTLDPRPSLKVRQHSPTGFEWGYAGSGPAQLTLALMLHATGDVDLSERCYQWVKWHTAATWSGDEWAVTAAALFDLVERWRAECAARDADELDAIAPFVPEPPTSNLVGVPKGGA